MSAATVGDDGVVRPIRFYVNRRCPYHTKQAPARDRGIDVALAEAEQFEALVESRVGPITTATPSRRLRNTSAKGCSAPQGVHSSAVHSVNPCKGGVGRVEKLQKRPVKSRILPKITEANREITEKSAAGTARDHDVLGFQLGMKAPVDGCATALAPWRFDPSEIPCFFFMSRKALCSQQKTRRGFRPGFLHSSG